MVLSDDVHELISLLAFVYLENNRPEKAETLLRALQALRQASPKDLTTLALSSLRAGRPEAALEVLDGLAMQGKMDASFHLLRAQALHASRREVEAQAAMRAYVDNRVASASSAMSSDEMDSRSL
jgi:predicted Zn-dependent protease